MLLKASLISYPLKMSGIYAPPTLKNNLYICTMKELVIIIGFIAWLTATIMIVFTIIGIFPLILFFEECKYWIDGTWELVFLKDGSLWQVRGHSELDGSTWFLKKIRYVHEFQNIYYEINEFDPFDKDEN